MTAPWRRRFPRSRRRRRSWPTTCCQEQEALWPSCLWPIWGSFLVSELWGRSNQSAPHKVQGHFKNPENRANENLFPRWEILCCLSSSKCFPLYNKLLSTYKTHLILERLDLLLQYKMSHLMWSHTEKRIYKILSLFKNLITVYTVLESCLIVVLSLFVVNIMVNVFVFLVLEWSKYLLFVLQLDVQVRLLVGCCCMC